MGQLKKCIDLTRNLLTKGILLIVKKILRQNRRKMSLLRHYFSDTKRVRQRCKMLQFEFVPVLCLIFGLLVQSPKILKADPQHGVAFPDGKTTQIYIKNIVLTWLQKTQV